MNELTLPYTLIAVLFALVILLAYLLLKLKRYFNKELLQNARNTMKWDANTNKTVTDFRDDMLQLNLARADDITKLRDETPRLEINNKNEAVLFTRTGKEIVNYQLKKTKK